MTTNNEDKLVDVLTGFSKRAEDFVGTIADWITTNAPDVAQEIVLVGRIECAIQCLIIFVVACISIICSMNGFRTWKQKLWKEGIWVALSLVPLAVLLIEFLIVVANIHVWITAFAAPKMYLLEYFKEYTV